MGRDPCPLFLSKAEHVRTILWSPQALWSELGRVAGVALCTLPEAVDPPGSLPGWCTPRDSSSERRARDHGCRAGQCTPF